jgi:segregation and condensation protein B
MDKQLKKIADRLRHEISESENDKTHKIATRALRIAEAVVFAAEAPVAEAVIVQQMPNGSPPIADIMAALEQLYRDRGVNLIKIGNGWTFRTSQDLAYLVLREKIEQRKLSRAALETLAIIAYHQPVTRAEMEEIRGVATSKGMLDILLEIGWVRMRGRRQSPGRPVTYGTTEGFLSHFNLERIADLPGIEELKAAGIVDPETAALLAIDPQTPDEEIALGEDIFDEMAEERINADEDRLDPEANA